MGMNIFNLYCLPLEDALPNNLQLSVFTDDHSVRKAFKAGNTELSGFTDDHSVRKGIQGREH